MGCFGGSSKSSSTQNMQSTQTQNLNPVANDAIFGPTGLFSNAASLYQNNPLQAYQGQTYAGLNPTQNAALQGTLSYLGMGGGQGFGQSAQDEMARRQQSLQRQYNAPQQYSVGVGDQAQMFSGPSLADQGLTPGNSFGTASGVAAGSPYSGGAYAGYNALNSLGSSLLGNSANSITLPGVSASQVGGNGIDMSQFGSITAPKVDGASVGGVGVNYQDALNRALSGSVDNPQLQQMMQDTANVSTENFLRNVLPQIRAQSRLAGGYGDSKDAIAQTLGASDLNNSIQRSNTGLLGNLYESAQNRAASTANNLSGQDMQAKIASAQLGQQANLANAGFDMQGQLANLQNALQGAQFNASQNQNAQLANQSAGLQAAGLNQSGMLSAFNANEAARQQALQNQLSGANLINQASQIPLQNYQTALNVGNAYQSDQQNQYMDAYQRFMQQQMAPWQTLGMYQSLIGPYAQLGSTTNTTGSSSSLTRNSQTPGLFDWINMLKPG